VTVGPARLLSVLADGPAPRRCDGRVCRPRPGIPGPRRSATAGATWSSPAVACSGARRRGGRGDAEENRPGAVLTRTAPPWRTSERSSTWRRARARAPVRASPFAGESSGGPRRVGDAVTVRCCGSTRRRDGSRSAEGPRGRSLGLGGRAPARAQVVRGAQCARPSSDLCRAPARRGWASARSEIPRSDQARCESRRECRDRRADRQHRHQSAASRLACAGGCRARQQMQSSVEVGAVLTGHRGAARALRSLRSVGQQTGLVPTAELSMSRGADAAQGLPGRERDEGAGAGDRGGRPAHPLSQAQALGREEQAETQAYLQQSPKRGDGRAHARESVKQRSKNRL